MLTTLFSITLNTVDCVQAYIHCTYIDHQPNALDPVWPNSNKLASLRGHTGFQQRPVLEHDQDLPNAFECMRI